MKRLLPLLLLLVPALALGKTWQVDAAHSTLGFSGDFQGETFHGVFKQFDAVIQYDPADLAHARFDVHVALASVDTQSSDRDQTLTGSDFFDTASYPKAHFVTRSFSTGADGSVLAHGTLTLHGISQPVTLKVDFAPRGDRAVLDVATELQRLDFGLGQSSDWSGISKTIAVRGHLQLH